MRGESLYNRLARYTRAGGVEEEEAGEQEEKEKEEEKEDCKVK